MKLLSYLFIIRVSAHESEGGLEEITNLSDAEWLGPIVTIIIILVAVFIAKIIKKRSRGRTY